MMSSLYVVSAEENSHQPREPYEAFTIATRRQRKLMLLNASGQVMGMPAYHYYVDAFCLASHTIWLLYSTSAFRLKGRNLPGDFLALFQEDRIKAIHCLSPLRHEPPEPDALVIESISRHTLQEFRQQGGEG